MSDDWIILIPEKAGHIPDQEARDNLLTKFREIASASDEISAHVGEKLEFEHSGINSGKIFCPDCGSQLESDWWDAQIEEDFREEDKSFRLGTHKLPCCGATKTLHDLRYEWPQGLAKFRLEAMNPNIGKLSTESLKDLEQVTGCQLRVIYRHL